MCLHIGDAVAKTRSIVHVNSLYLHGKMSCKLAVTHCVICRTDVANDDDVATVSRGLNTLLEFSQKYNDAELYEYLLSKPPVVKVHNKCRNNYTSKTKLEQVIKRAGEQNESEVVKKKALRSSLNGLHIVSSVVSCVLKTYATQKDVIAGAWRHCK